MMVAFYVLYYLKRTLDRDSESLASGFLNIKDSKQYSIKFLKKFKLNMTSIQGISEKLNQSFISNTEVKEIFNFQDIMTAQLSKDQLVLQLIRVVVQSKLFKKCLNCINQNFHSQDKTILIEYLMRNKYCKYLVSQQGFDSIILNLVFNHTSEFFQLRKNSEYAKLALKSYLERLIQIKFNLSTVYQKMNEIYKNIILKLYKVIEGVN